MVPSVCVPMATWALWGCSCHVVEFLFTASLPPQAQCKGAGIIAQATAARGRLRLKTLLYAKGKYLTNTPLWELPCILTPVSKPALV